MRVGWVLAAVYCAVLVAGCGSDGEPEGEPLPADAEVILAASATAMSDVRSVRFELTRSGAPVFIDEFDSLALDALEGRFSAPTAADAVLTVTVDGSLSTKLGAVALDGEVWLSNPVTGRFEVFDPGGYDLDPSTFFDPQEGWGPLMRELEDAELVGVEDRGGKRYHLRGVAPQARVERITGGLAREQDVAIDLWVRRDTGLVTAATFDTTFEGRTTSWELELRDYGESFEIEAPDVDG